MSYNILGINPFHNGSACVLSDGEIVFFLEEERLTKYKYDANPFRVIEEILSKFKINEVIIAGINIFNSKLNFTYEDPFLCFIRKHLNIQNIKFTDISNSHHLTHATHSFFNSGFNEAIGFVFDAGGSLKVNKKNNTSIIEQNSIFFLSQNKVELLSVEGIPDFIPKPKTVGLTHANIYGYFANRLGFGYPGGEGKMMGLSSYGRKNPNIPSLFKTFKTDPNLIWYKGMEEGWWEEINEKFFSLKENYNWKITNPKQYEYEKDLAWRIQNDSQNIVKKYIQKYIKETGIKNIVCSGGYFLNCVANYYLTKEFPDVNFYFEPVSHDGGTAIGAAFYRWKQLNPSFKPEKQKTLYYGPKYSKEQLLKGIKKYV